MKYWNKQKEYRRQHWATALPPPIHQMKEAKQWCQRQESTGKFYFHFTNTRWWFENKDDAVIFSLRWSSAGNV